ncbi:hypothetical protein A5630_10155 [Mycolicibacterium mucogenicum]|uniref:Uncharacterized protein n=1 Tax=Mycolicibacterium mucogenicum TaxID=56689 RepID=A0A1A3GHY9_MYCMU|nr:hypothetical protein [Mycolicibacterium mucogenicum]OBJ35004.1 hypothetical protein A5630_10155 [Mycolicibacterium mucogenicum]
MCGQNAWWSVTLNHAELHRRREANADALQRLEMVSTLLGLPIDVPVPAEALRPTQLRALADLPEHLVSWDEGHLIRRTTPPLCVNHVVVRARTFRRGLEAVSEFATYCAGSVVLPAAAPVTDWDLSEASYYGVGVYRASSDRLACLVEAESFPDWPETAASWVFSETLWQQLRPQYSVGIEPIRRAVSPTP